MVRTQLANIWNNNERRHHPRAGQPWLRVETQGFAYMALDWSVGGIAIEHFHNAGPVGTFVAGEAGWADADTLTPFVADITRRDPNGVTVLRWLDVGEELLTQLGHVAQHR
jgi:hypothetical protein